MQLKALLLDLDGTLVDTAPDMVSTLNRVLTNHGQPPAVEASAQKLVSDGARALLEFGFGEQLEQIGRDQLIKEFLDDYAEHVCEKSKLYAGMQAVLNLCMTNNIRWGVVTNKPLHLSRAVLDGLNILDQCSILLGGDSLAVKKPDPAPLLHCCMAMNLAASECLYVGDHERDIVAGKAAGMDTAVALWGYIKKDHNPNQWNANFLLNQPTGLFNLIDEQLTQHLPK